MRPVFICKQKLHGGRGLWPAYVVAEDDFGTWLFSPKGTKFRGEQDGELVGILEVGQGDRDEGLDVLCLVPRTGWWFAGWWGPPVLEPTVSVDISLPPTFAEGTWTYVDLELDVYQRGTEVGIQDEDEFEDSYAAGLISEDERTQSLAATAAIEKSLRAHTPPFDGTGWALLEEFAATGMPVPAWDGSSVIPT